MLGFIYLQTGTQEKTKLQTTEVQLETTNTLKAEQHALSTLKNVVRSGFLHRHELSVASGGRRRLGGDTWRQEG